MFFQILGAIAEFEHALMSERTTDGLAAARARGQKPILGPRQVKLAREMYEETGEDGNGATRSPRSPRSSASPAPPSTATSPGPPDNDAAVPVPGLAELSTAQRRQEWPGLTRTARSDRGRRVPADLVAL